MGPVQWAKGIGNSVMINYLVIHCDNRFKSWDCMYFSALYEKVNRECVVSCLSTVS